MWPNEYFCKHHTSIKVFNIDSIHDNMHWKVKQAQYPKQETLKQWAPIHNLALQDGTYWHHRTALVVVADNRLKRGVISIFHNYVATGHARITQTLQLIIPYFW